MIRLDKKDFIDSTLDYYNSIACNIYEDIKHTEGFCTFFNYTYHHCSRCSGFNTECIPKICDILDSLSETLSEEL